MPARTDSFDLASLRLNAGEGRRLELEVELEPLEFGGQAYAPPRGVPLLLDVSRMTHLGYALRLRFSAALDGPCMRCLADAHVTVDVDAREVDQPGDIDELDSPYVVDQVLDLRRLANDALVLALPAQVLCRPQCAGLCAVCGADLNDAGADHGHERPPDPRWAKLAELNLDPPRSG